MIGDFSCGSFRSFSIAAVHCFTFAVRQNRTHIEALMFCSKDDRDHHRGNHSLLAGCLMATLPFPQPDYETRDRRIRALFARLICEKIAPRAYWRMPEPKFFKQCRRLAGSRIERKNH
jgi:hypothetical protein